MHRKSFKSCSTYLSLFLSILIMSGCTGGCNKGAESDDKSQKSTATQKEALSSGKEASESAIQPPIPAADPSYITYEIDPNKDTTIRYPTGSKIHIPAKAFLTQDGKVVKEEVEVRYREMHDPVSFFAAGVPMTVQENGEKKMFESAGMCDIRASMKAKEEGGPEEMRDQKKNEAAGRKESGKNRKKRNRKASASSNGNGSSTEKISTGNGKGRELKVNPDRKIKVEMASEVEGDFPVYQMNEETGEWKRTTNGPGATKPLTSSQSETTDRRNFREPLIDKVSAQSLLSISPPSRSVPNTLPLYRIEKLEMKGVDIDETSYEGDSDEPAKKNAGGTMLVERTVTFVKDRKAPQKVPSRDQRTIRAVERSKNSLFIPSGPESCDFPPFVSELQLKRVKGSDDLFKVTAYSNDERSKKYSCTCKEYENGIQALSKELEKEWAAYHQEVKEYHQRRDSLLVAYRDSLQEEYREEIREFRQMVDSLREAGDQEALDSIKEARDSIERARARKRVERQLEESNFEAAVSRVMTINDFGFTNCDSPESYPNEAEIIVKLRNEEGGPLSVPNIRLATMDPKTLINFKDRKKIQFDPKVQTLLWGTTPKGALAYCPPDRFGAIDPSNGSTTLRLNTKKDISSFEELQNTLLPDKGS